MTTAELEVDLLVVGWGKAGKTLARRYASAGRSVALVERDPAMYGGTCINVACVPTGSGRTPPAPRRSTRSWRS